MSHRRRQRLTVLVVVVLLAGVVASSIATAETNKWDNLAIEIKVDPFDFDWYIEGLRRLEDLATSGDTRTVYDFAVWPLWYQTDSQWANDVMLPCGSLIRDKGCMITSAAMVYHYFGANTNPKQVNLCMGNKACNYDQSHGAQWCSQGTTRYWGSVSFSYQSLATAFLMDMGPVITRVQNSSGSMHFVVVRTMIAPGTSAGDFWVNDPLRGYVTLAHLISIGWTPQTINYYSHVNW